MDPTGCTDEEARAALWALYDGECRTCQSTGVIWHLMPLASGSSATKLIECPHCHGYSNPEVPF